MSNLGSQGDTQLFTPPLLSKLAMRLLNEVTTLTPPWIIPLGETSCVVHLGQPSLYVAEKVFLRFQCENDLIQIALEDLSILWLHPALSSVRYDSPLSDVVILPILEALFAPLKHKLQNILHVPVIFLGFFYEPLVDYQFGCAITLIFDSPKLEENKSYTGLMRSNIPLRIYIPEGNSAKNFLIYLQTLPKNNVMPLALPLEMNIRVGYSLLTIKELMQITTGDVLFPYDYPILRNRLSLVFWDKEIFCSVEGRHIKVLGWNGTTLFSQKPPIIWRSESNIRTKSTDHPLEVTISFELGKYNTTLSELEHFIEGYTFTLELDIHSPVILSFEDKTIGTGVLMNFNGVIGIRILEFSTTVDE